MILNVPRSSDKAAVESLLQRSMRMAVRKPEGSDNIFVVDVDMENRSPEDIARDAAMQINALFDRLVKEQKEKNDQDAI